MSKTAYRNIIHLDLDAFFCAVEEIYDPSVSGKPIAVGGRPESRGVVSSCSYPARLKGIHSAMPMRTAVHLLPSLIIIPPHFKKYRLASRRVMNILREITPLVEQISIDEAFLDVTDNQENPEVIGRSIQRRLKVELRLPSSIGIASNKLVAKIANDVGKGRHRSADYPYAVTVVPHGEEASFLAPLPAKRLWGVGPKTEEKLNHIGIQTIGDIAKTSDEELSRMFGKVGWDLVKRARGIDNRSVKTTHQAKSVSHERTYAVDIAKRAEAEKEILRLSSYTAKSLQRKNLRGKTIKLKCRWSNFETLTRQKSLSSPTDDPEIISSIARTLLRETWTQGRKVRLLGVGVSNLEKGLRQPGLWDEDTKKNQALFELIDSLETRFGENIIHLGLDDSGDPEQMTD